MAKIPARSEQEEQVAVFNWIRQIGMAKWPELELVAGSAFGVRLRIGQAVKLKASGCLKKGWPDIFIAAPRKRTDALQISTSYQGPGKDALTTFEGPAWYHGMFIELKPLTRGVKKPKREGPDKDQRRMLKALSDQGYYAICCFGAEAAIREITAYMEGKV
jgi:hypothetical protein